MWDPRRKAPSPAEILEKRIEAVLDDGEAAPPPGIRRELEDEIAPVARRWRRGVVLAAVAVMPLLAFAAVTFVSNGNLDMHLVFGTGSQQGFVGKGHPAPLFDSMTVATPEARAAWTPAALAPTPTVVPLDNGESCDGGINAAGTPIAETAQCVAARLAPKPAPTRPAPRHPSTR